MTTGMIEAIRANAERMENKVYKKGYDSAAEELWDATEIDMRNFAIKRLKEMLENGESVEDVINELTREVCSLEIPINVNHKDRLAYDVTTKKFIPYYLT